MNPLDHADKIGAGRTFEDPNDPALTGVPVDKAAQVSPEAKSVLINYPQAPDPSPFVIRGG